MATRTSSDLKINTVYTRDQLRENFGITDSTLNNGIFRPKDTSSVWLFVTEEKTPDRVQYTDHLDGDTLLMQGQTEGRTDHLIKDQATNGLELLVFHRMKKYENEGAGFRYLGPFRYVRSQGTRPTSFVLIRDTGRDFRYGKPSWLWIVEAVQQLGGSARQPDIEKYVLGKVPTFKNGNFGPDLSISVVNSFGRSNFPPNHAPRRTDTFNVYDALYRRETSQGPSYELYDPVIHGVWALEPDTVGKMRPVAIPDSREFDEATRAAEEDGAFDVNDETDARRKMFKSIVVRQGQPKFRKTLLAAYDRRCAVTGCDVEEVLEAAHIKPYQGDHTHHVTNGLLLRADIHTLFDLGLMRIHPLTIKVEIAPRVWSAFREFDGLDARVPEDASKRPNGEALRHHFNGCALEFEQESSSELSGLPHP
ncbi:MAG: HNH endonuclease [Comamonadaceae bacterium]|nr:MAG: HNH endonuclease [Comamonadaceae bacterium]